MKPQVFCIDCKHSFYQPTQSGGYSPRLWKCKLNPEYKIDFFEKTKIYNKCHIKNQNNDCQDFKLIKKNILVRIYNKIKGK